MPADDIQDAQWLRRAARGDSEAFASLYQRRQADIYRFALHMTASPSMADDVTQEVFLTVMREGGRYDESRATVMAWLCGIARNHVRRRLERDRPLQQLHDAEGDDDMPLDLLQADQPDLLGDLTTAERIEALHRAVLTLPLKYREALVLCDLQELRYADAASALGCAVGTVRSRLHRARALLTTKLTAVDADRRTATAFSRTDEMASDVDRSTKSFGPVRRSLA
jgi:RNA polymerase sigma-70 factor (ECF subfamily)